MNGSGLQNLNDVVKAAESAIISSRYTAVGTSLASKVIHLETKYNANRTSRNPSPTQNQSQNQNQWNSEVKNHNSELDNANNATGRVWPPMGAPVGGQGQTSGSNANYRAGGSTSSSNTNAGSSYQKGTTHGSGLETASGPNSGQAQCCENTTLSGTIAPILGQTQIEKTGGGFFLNEYRGSIDWSAVSDEDNLSRPQSCKSINSQCLSEVQQRLEGGTQGIQAGAFSSGIQAGAFSSGVAGTGTVHSGGPIGNIGGVPSGGFISNGSGGSGGGCIANSGSFPNSGGHSGGLMANSGGSTSNVINSNLIQQQQNSQNSNNPIAPQNCNPHPQNGNNGNNGNNHLNNSNPPPPPRPLLGGGSGIPEPFMGPLGTGPLSNMGLLGNVGGGVLRNEGIGRGIESSFYVLGFTSTFFLQLHV